MSENTDPTANAHGGGDFSTGLRLGLAAALGHSGYAQRDRYDVFGWEKDPDPEEYYGLYLRNPYAYAAVAQKPATTWRDPPTIVDGTHPEDVTPSDDGLTAFERRVRALGTDHDVWSYAHRVDRLAGIGTHGLLVLDLDDTDGPDDFADPPATSDPADADEPTPGTELPTSERGSTACGGFARTQQCRSTTSSTASRGPIAGGSPRPTTSTCGTIRSTRMRALDPTR
jgi:hypothetical protein